MARIFIWLTGRLKPLQESSLRGWCLREPSSELLGNWPAVLSGRTSSLKLFVRVLKHQFFRQQVLNLLRSVCRIRKALPTPEHWDCAAEVPTPWTCGGRVDLRIGPVTRTRDVLPVFYLESKVESPLTLQQLRRYRRHGVQHLVAVTKYPPKLTQREIEKAGVFVLRWQDLHRLLRERAPTYANRFIARSLAEYLGTHKAGTPPRLRAEGVSSCESSFSARLRA